jgi:hypothetical protein
VTKRTTSAEPLPRMSFVGGTRQGALAQDLQFRILVLLSPPTGEEQALILFI